MGDLLRTWAVLLAYFAMILAVLVPPVWLYDHLERAGRRS